MSQCKAGLDVRGAVDLSNPRAQPLLGRLDLDDAATPTTLVANILWLCCSLLLG
jgi:hypothetical protein